MIKRYKLYWRIFWKLRALHLQRMFELRGDFVFWAGISLFWTFFNILFFDVITQASGSIGGWNREQMLLLLGVFSMLDAFTWSFFYHNMQRYTDAIFSGDLSHILLKPVDAQFLIMTYDNNYSNIFRLLLGGLVVVRAFWLTGQPLNILQIGLFLISFLASLLLIYSLWFILATGAFWVEKLNNINEIIPSVRRAWQVPHTVYTGLASLLFMVIFPVGIISSVPSQVLLGNSQWWLVGYLWVMSLVAFWLSRIFFHFSLHRFSGNAG
jgi:ABC-2 type transport system permease protein